MDNQTKIMFAGVGIFLLIIIVPSAYATLTVWYSLTTSTSNFCYTGGATNCIFTGEYVVDSESSLEGKPVNYIQIRMNKNGSPAGNFTVGVWDISAGAPTENNYIYRIGKYSTSTIAAGAFSWYTFNTTDPFILNAGNIIGVYYAGGSSTHNLSTSRHDTGSGSSPVDGAHSCWGWYGNAQWNTAINCDTTFFSDFTAVIGYNLEDGGGSSGSSVACIEVVLGGSQVCYDDTDGNGIPNFPNGSLDSITPPTRTLPTITGTLLCGTGVSSTPCTESDPKVNGAGLALLITVVLGSYAVLVSIHVGAVRLLNKNNVQVMDYLNINPVLLLVMLIIDTGFAYYSGWVSDVIFYTVLVVMGGLAAWGYFSAVRGRGSSA